MRKLTYGIIAAIIAIASAGPANACIAPNNPFCDIMDWPY